MKNYKIIVVALSLATVQLGASVTARAQVAEGAAEAVAAPVIAKVVSAVAPKKDPPGSSWLKAQVIHADSRSMIVQEEANPKMIHTFTYGPRIKDRMQDLENEGGYRYGDKVKILYQQAEPGQFVALRIKGKPS